MVLHNDVRNQNKNIVLKRQVHLSTNTFPDSSVSHHNKEYK